MTKTSTHQIKKAANGFGLTRDDIALRTPQKHALILPTREMAEAVVEELSSAKKFVLSSMPLTAMAFTAIDVATEYPDKMVQAMLAFAETDLLLYRSEGEELAARQRAGWDPVLAWLAEHHGVSLSITEGIMPLDQPVESLQKLEQILTSFTPFEMAAFSVLTQAFGSLVLGLAVKGGKLDAEEGFRLSRVDEDYQTEKWGEDTIALARAREIARDAKAAAKFLELSSL